jgi:hypothetical protein
VENKGHIEHLRAAVEAMHNCLATHRGTVAVREAFQGKTVWIGNVEVFDISGNPAAGQCFAWAHLDGPKDERTRIVAVLGVPPIVTPQKAVQASIVADFKSKKLDKKPGP